MEYKEIISYNKNPWNYLMITKRLNSHISANKKGQSDVNYFPNKGQLIKSAPYSGFSISKRVNPFIIKSLIWTKKEAGAEERR